jgi:5-methylcytosine-specific restriction protein B
LSYFWALQDHVAWPVIWSSAAAFVDFVTGSSLPTQPADRYTSFHEVVGQLDDDNQRFERVARWWESEKPVFLDPVLADRCRLDEIEPHADHDAYHDNAAALVRVAQHISTALADEVSASAGRTLQPARLGLEWMPGSPRVDLPIDWWVPNAGGVTFRLWVNGNGAAIGVRPGLVRKGWLDEAAEILAGADVPGFRLLAARDSKHGQRVGFQGGSSGEFVYARWFDRDQFAALDVRREIVEAAAAVRPQLNKLVERATGIAPHPNDPLKPFVEEFVGTGYPTPADVEHRSDRESFATLLAHDSLRFADPVDVRRIWNTGRYGAPGPQSVLNTSLRDADPIEVDRILASIDYLCWGEDHEAARIDRVLSDESLRVRGLGESVIMKLLAICHPQRYLCVYPYVGTLGKRRMLKVLSQKRPVTRPARSRLPPTTCCANVSTASSPATRGG